MLYYVKSRKLRYFGFDKIQILFFKFFIKIIDVIIYGLIEFLG